jgi:glycosyltransferase involved in cell wall biosynthesis
VTVGIPGGLIAFLKRAPMLMWILDCWPETLKAIGVGGGPIAQALVGLMVRGIYAGADLLLGQSRGFEANVARHGDRAKFRHFPNWVEDAYAGAEAPPTPLLARAAPGEFTILYAGNVGEAQDFATVAAAADLLRDDPVRFVIVGDGRDLERTRADVRARGLEARFHFAGRHPPDAMPGFFAHADALLVSLKADPLFALTVPGKVQTYLAAGRPILAMLNGEGAEVVRESGAGLVVPSGDAPALARAATELMAMPPARRTAMASRGRAYAEAHFSLPALLDRLECWTAEARRA